MAHDAGAGVVPQHAGDALVGFLAAVADDHHAGVLAVTHADAAAVVEADPGRSSRRVQQGVEDGRSEEHTSELQSLMRISYAVFCLKKKISNASHLANHISV